LVIPQPRNSLYELAPSMTFRIKRAASDPPITMPRIKREASDPPIMPTRIESKAHDAPVVEPRLKREPTDLPITTPRIKREASEPADIERALTKRRVQDTSTSELPSPPSAGFGSLPKEFILEILDIFGVSKYKYLYDIKEMGICSLYNLCLTNRQLNRLSKPYLYTAVENDVVDSRKLLKILLKESQMLDQVEYLIWLDHHGTTLEHDTWDRIAKKLLLTHIERRDLCKKVKERGLVDPQSYFSGFQMQATQRFACRFPFAMSQHLQP
jgi:hypothetical protein